VSQTASNTAAPQALSAEDRTRLERATELHAAGDLDGAEALYLSLLSARSAQVERLHFVLGMLYDKRGDKAAALDHYDRAMEAGFVSPMLAANRAELLRRAGRTVEALAAYDLAIALGQGGADLHHARGVVLAALGRSQEALAAYDTAIALQDDNPKAHGNRGVALEALGQTEAAVEAYMNALRLDPSYRHAHHNLGSALLKLEAHDEAVSSFERALKLDAGVPECWNLLGMALCGLSRYEEALACFERTIQLRPTFAEAFNNRSIAQRWLRRFDAAVGSATHAFALDPTLAPALNSRGSALLRLNRLDDALLDFNAAIALRPRFAGAILNRGTALEAMGEVEAALEDFREALLLEPNIPDGEFNLALAHLRLGDYRQGFKLYERRWDKRTGPFLPHPRELLWQDQAVDGLTVLITGEQGFGDMVQFCRFAGDVAALGARVVLQVQSPLKRLMQGMVGPIEVIGFDEPTPAFDLFCPTMSLPRALNLDRDEVRRGPYLFAADRDMTGWQESLGERQGLRVGLAWTGNPYHENDHNRSAPLQALAPLFDRGFDLVSLQNQHHWKEAGCMEASGIRAFDTQLHDFSDTAGLIAACDAVVSVDTAVAHLAAAMGKPTFILLPKVSDWRWQDRLKDTVWYPSARLFRQAAPRDWTAPVAEASEALDQLKAERSC
jgi:tetratricopeptide (TPR) repeat protein